MDRVYELGKHKLQNRKDIGTDEFEYERDQEICTFKPTLNQNSQKMGKESIVMSKVRSQNTLAKSYNTKDL